MFLNMSQHHPIYQINTNLWNKHSHYMNSQMENRNELQTLKIHCQYFTEHLCTIVNVNILRLAEDLRTFKMIAMNSLSFDGDDNYANVPTVTRYKQQTINWNIRHSTSKTEHNNETHTTLTEQHYVLFKQVQ